MDIENYNQYTLNAEVLEQQPGFMTDDPGGMITLLIDGQVMAMISFLFYESG